MTAFLLTVAYARGLQYWVEKLNLLESPGFCPLVGSIMELREVVREHIVSTNWELLRDLGRVNLAATYQWPQPSSSRRVVPPSELDNGFTEATTQSVSLAISNAEPIRCITSQDRMEEENWYLLVIMTSIRQLSLGSVGDDLRDLSAAQPGRNTFQNPCMAAVLSGSIRVVGYPGATMKELEV